MLNLTVLLFERAGLIIILAFFLVNIPQFRKLLFRKDWSTTFQLFAIFSIFTIVANLIGVELRPDNSIQFKSLLQNVTPGDSVSGSGTALQNLNVRLMGLYGKDAELKISSDQNGTQVVIQIPYKEQV